MKTPKAAEFPKLLENHGITRVDEFYWMNDRDHPDLIPYLNAENTYYQHHMRDCEELVDKLYAEIRSRIKEDDESLPVFKNGYWYISKTKKDLQYPIFTRRKGTLDAEEELLFDVNQMAEGHSFYQFASYKINEANTIAAFCVDTVSRREYLLRFKDLKTGALLKDQIEKTTGGCCWSNDNKAVYYTRKDPVTLRAYRIYKHIIGTESEQDQLVYEETDTEYTVGVYKSKSKAYIIIESASTNSTEYQYCDANSHEASFEIFHKREKGLEYSIAHYGAHFYILTNKDAAFNFKLMRTSTADTAIENWTEFIEHNEAILLEDFEFFESHYCIDERVNGLSRLKIIDWNTSDCYIIPLLGETYVAHFQTNVEFNSTKLRYFYSSMTKAPSVFEIDLNTKEIELLKQQEVQGTYDEEQYESKRIWATSEDQKSIPISMVYHKKYRAEDSKKLVLYAYGSYGSTIDPYFSIARLSLLNRGFTFAIAHIRGGEYLGRPWYDSGKLLHKKNTFNDYKSCALHLIKQGYTNERSLIGMGGSAGGLLMGVALNEYPQLFKAIIAQVPFVDVVTTMLDESIPLTTGEYEEWGNPNNPTFFDYMKSYSPYDNVVPQDYPHLLITAGLHDSQVQYWEPAKWVARLRKNKTDQNLLLFEINMDTGHSGASGRFESIKEVAKEYAFILKVLDEHQR